MSDAIYKLATQVADFVAAAKTRAADGLTVAEFWQTTTDLLRLTVAALDTIPGEGQAKKEYALAAVALLFDGVADKMIPAVAWPVWLLFRSSVRGLVLAAAAGAIESLLPLVRSAA